MTHAQTLFMAGFAVLLLNFSAMAQNAEDQAACVEDVVKYCPTQTGKPDELLKCMATNKDKLGETCKKVVEKTAS